MRIWLKTLAIGLLLAIILTNNRQTLAVTEITQDAEIQGDPKTIKAIRSVFDQAEEALGAKNLSGMMAVYSKNYQNSGLRKVDTALIWKDIFSRYEQLSSRHAFSKILVEQGEHGQPTAKVICTGVLFGVPILKKEKPPAAAPVDKPRLLDAWVQTTHYMVYENGKWKIIGHDPSADEDHPFAAALHLLF